jgi:hypothetical protein
MNVKRGVVRAWIVLTVLYWALQLFSFRPHDAPPITWQFILWVFLVPPIGIAVGLAALAWILSGFVQKIKG